MKKLYVHSLGTDPATDFRRVVVSNKQTYVHEILVNCLVKLAQEKVWL